VSTEAKKQKKGPPPPRPHKGRMDLQGILDWAEYHDLDLGSYIGEEFSLYLQALDSDDDNCTLPVDLPGGAWPDMPMRPRRPAW
jgi:hypothetical protein